MKYHIQEGFGPLDAFEQCWNVRLIKVAFDTVEEAGAFADRWYERKIKKDSSEWQYYWVRVLNV
jgi:hypothetical protein